MRWGNLTKFLAVVLVILAAAGYYMMPLALSIKQGLDLQGGTHVVLEASDTPEAQVNEDAMQRVVHIIERRINELGLTEPIVQRQGERRIIVELPGVKDPEKAIEMLGRTALMEFQDESGAVVLTGKDLKDAKAQIDQGGQKLVSIEFTDEGAKKFADLTAKNVGKHIAILLDKQILTNPVVNTSQIGCFAS
ncbi:MAG: secDF [Sporomusa sp.]|nr:secDF [Sporomusa sp.]